MQFSCHHTSYPDFWHQHISVSPPVTYSYRSSLGFYFISRLEDDEATLRQLAIDGSVLFASSRRISAYFFYVIRNSLSGSRPFQLRGHIHPVPLRLSFFLIAVSLQKHFSCHIYPSRRPDVRHVWSAAACHLAGTTAAPEDGFVVATSHCCFRHSSYCIWFALPTHYQCLCRVSLMHFRASRLNLSYAYDVFALVSLGLLLRIGDSFLTRNFPTCYLNVRYCVF